MTNSRQANNAANNAAAPAPAAFASAASATLALAFAFAAAGCSSVLAPKADTARYYALANATAPDVSAPANAAAPKEKAPPRFPAGLRLATFRIPDLYDRAELVWGAADHRLAIRDSERWLEPLPKAAARVFAHDLAQALALHWLPYPPATGTGREARLHIDITHLEIRPDRGQIRLHARWQLAPAPPAPAAGGVTSRAAASPVSAAPSVGSIGIATPLPAAATPEQIAAALSVALNDLAQATARALAAAPD